MTHLNPIQRNLLLALLKGNEDLFDGQLGDWVGDPIEIPLKEGAKPYHAKAFPIPHIHEQTFKKDLDRLDKVHRRFPKGESQRMGSTGFHYRKERWPGEVYFRL